MGLNIKFEQLAIAFGSGIDSGENDASGRFANNKKPPLRSNSEQDSIRSNPECPKGLPSRGLLESEPLIRLVPHIPRHLGALPNAFMCNPCVRYQVQPMSRIPHLKVVRL